MDRSVLHISMDELLLAAIRFAAQRDGLAPSQKARQALMQAFQRTMESQAFLEYASEIGLGSIPDEDD